MTHPVSETYIAHSAAGVQLSVAMIRGRGDA